MPPVDLALRTLVIREEYEIKASEIELLRSLKTFELAVKATGRYLEMVRAASFLRDELNQRVPPRGRKSVDPEVDAQQRSQHRSRLEAARSLRHASHTITSVHFPRL